jgi:hypothetical protein
VNKDGNPVCDITNDKANPVCDRNRKPVFDAAMNPLYISIGSHQQALLGSNKKEKGETQFYNEDMTHSDSAERLTRIPSADAKDALPETNIRIILDSVSSQACFLWNGADVYITVDRDFTIGSYTPYGDGEYLPAVGRSAVIECICYLQDNGATLVGFDVVGLPSRAGKCKNSDSSPFDQAVKESIEDIRIFHKSVSNYRVGRISTTLSRTLSEGR